MSNTEPDKVITEHLRCVFSKDEKMELSEELANALTSRKRVESRMRISAAEFKKQLKDTDERIEELSDWVSSGYELREVECSVYFHEPKQGQKTILRDDTGEVVNVALMTAEDMQMALDLKVEIDEVDVGDDEESNVTPMPTTAPIDGESEDSEEQQ